MTNSDTPIRFHNRLAPLMKAFIEEKRACGYRYHDPARLLFHFDQFLCGETLEDDKLPWAISRKWVAKRPHESARTHQRRITVVRQFALFMQRQGYQADVPERILSARQDRSFMPRILTHQEIKQLLQAVDQLAPNGRTPFRHLIMPEIFRLLYGCGFRISEVLNLRMRDVDLNQGILTVREGKFGKDRLVPPARSLVARLRTYVNTIGNRTDNALLFPSHVNDKPVSIRTVYSQFRQLLHACGIPYSGRGKGPRVHDLRHTFAVHSLLRWYREGAELNAKLPVLAAYLGHRSVAHTQYYLHLTAELFPEITKRVNLAFDDVIPLRRAP
jgi:integrase/recombinase XerD